jgi:hypothetical protein
VANQLPPLKSKTTHAEFYCKGKLMDSYLDSLYGMTSAPLMDTPGEAKSMLSAGVFPVRTSLPQEKEMDLMGKGQDSGQKWRGWLAKFDPDSCLWRIAQCSLLEEECELLQTLPRWGMTVDGLLWEQPMWEPHTKGTEYGLLPNNESFFHTPNTTGMDGGSNSRKALRKRMEMWPTPTVGCVEGGEQSNRVEKTQSGGYILRKLNKPHMTYGAKLSDAVLYEQKKKFPTPQASDHRDRGNMSNPSVQRRVEIGKQISLSQSVHPTSGQLNPMWVEWLMGWPIGWTDLKPLGTDKFPSALPPLGDS